MCSLTLIDRYFGRMLGLWCGSAHTRVPPEMPRVLHLTLTIDMIHMAVISAVAGGSVSSVRALGVLFSFLDRTPPRLTLLSRVGGLLVLTALL